MRYKPKSIAALQVALGGCQTRCTLRQTEASACRQKRSVNFAR